MYQLAQVPVAEVIFDCVLLEISVEVIEHSNSATHFKSLEYLFQLGAPVRQIFSSLPLERRGP